MTENERKKESRKKKAGDGKDSTSRWQNVDVKEKERKGSEELGKGRAQVGQVTSVWKTKKTRRNGRTG